ncbi:MAG: Hsp70 family protein [Myxococcota bacterium]
MGRCIGIDLGTTNSCAAYIVNGRPKMIEQHNGATALPSIYTIDEEGRELVGHEAKTRSQSNPHQTITASKRLIGRNFHSKNIDEIRQLFTYEVVEGDSSEVLIKIRDRLLTLEEISAAILKRLKAQASKIIGEAIDSAVITVPAYFNERQRQAVREAGELAELKVLRIINEPTAAALSYGVVQGDGKRIAVYDLGGGTFDMSVIDIDNSVFKVLATGGDTFLGGVDFDDRLMQYLLEEFLNTHDIDLSYDRIAVQRIKDAAEESKIKLSTLHKTRVNIPYITQSETEKSPIDLDIPLTRTTLERLTEDLVDRSIQSCMGILSEAKTTAETLDELLLVGGQSRMPLIRKRLTNMLNKAPAAGVDPDDSVALGAAIMAHAITSDENNLTLLDVLPLSIGLRKSNGQVHVLFPKNARLPTEKKQTLTTSRDNQKSIALRLYQGEALLAEDNDLLGSYVFSGFPLMPKGEVKLKVHFQISSDGLLNLSAVNKKTGEPVQLTVLSQSVPEEGDSPAQVAHHSQSSKKSHARAQDASPANPETSTKPSVHEIKPSEPQAKSIQSHASHTANPVKTEVEPQSSTENPHNIDHSTSQSTTPLDDQNTERPSDEQDQYKQFDQLYRPLEESSLLLPEQSTFWQKCKDFFKEIFS